MYTKIALGKASDYYLAGLTKQEPEVGELYNPCERYHIRNLSAITIGTATTMDRAIQNANRLKSHGAIEIYDTQKDEYWTLRTSLWAGIHEFFGCAETECRSFWSYLRYLISTNY